jgi:hypothetical protein
MSHHLPHLVMMLVPFAVFAGIFGVQWRLSADTPLPAPLWLMTGLTASAGSIHGGVTAHHAHEAVVLGWAMAVMCAAQLTWACWLLFAPTVRVVEVGVLGNLAVIVLWAWTRLLGIPFGIAGGQRQAIGGWDATCTLVEVAAVLAGLLQLATSVPRPVRLRVPARVS